MKKTTLVTGGTGFIGSHTTVELQAAGYDVVIIDNLSNSKAEVVEGIEKISGVRPAFEQVDCCDLPALEGVSKNTLASRVLSTLQLLRLSVNPWSNPLNTTRTTS